MSRAILAEWIKLRSLRSTWYALACLFVVSLGITMMSSSVAQEVYADAIATVPDPDFPHPWWNMAGMAVGVVAVLVAAFVLLRRRDV